MEEIGTSIDYSPSLVLPESALELRDLSKQGHKQCSKISEMPSKPLLTHSRRADVFQNQTCEKHEPAVRLRVYEIEAAGCNVDFIGNFTQESLGGL